MLKVIVVIVMDLWITQTVQRNSMLSKRKCDMKRMLPMLLKTNEVAKK